MKRRRTEIEDLRDETLMEILIRVPVKSIHQCKVVSKRWLALISDPYFVDCHRRIQHHQDNNHIHLVNYYSTTGNDSYNDLSFTSIMKSYYIPSNNNNYLQIQSLVNQEWPSSLIFGVSNDLLLTVTNHHLSVSNPITKQCYTLPDPPPPTIRLFLIDFRGIVCSVDDPTRYKVVVVKDSPELVRRGGSVVRSSDFLKFFVFSSDTRSWCNFVVPAPPTFLLQAVDGEANAQYSTTLDGALYWCTNMIMKYNPFDNDDIHNCEFINLPPEASVPVHDKWSSLCIGNVEHKLRLYHWQFVTDSTQTITVWDLNKDDNSTWNTKQFVDLTSINWNSQLSSSSSKDVRMSIKGFDPNDGDVLYVFSTKHHCLLSVNLRRKTVELVSDFKSTASFRLFPYCPPLWPTPAITNAVAPTFD